MAKSHNLEETDISEAISESKNDLHNVILPNILKHSHTKDRDVIKTQKQSHEEKAIVETPIKMFKNAIDVRNTEDVSQDSTSLGYHKRNGAMSVTGQLYETKLLTLVLLRFLNDINTAEFYLGANITGAGALDDLCFKYRTVNGDKHVIVFLQAKHKVNPDKGKITMSDVCSNVGDFSVENHFDSYLMVRQKFTPKSSDIIFKGAYHGSQCFFIVYTPLKHDVECKKPLEQNDINLNLKELVQTNLSGDIFQLDYKDVEFLTKNMLEKRANQLGKRVYELILSGSTNIMDDEYIKTYHVVLAQKVIEVGATDEGVRRGKFRSEFFNNKEKLMTIFRESLFNEAVNKKTSQRTDEDLRLLRLLKHCPAAYNISKVIGNVVTYDSKTNLLVLLDEKLKDEKDLEFLKQNKIDLSIVKNAIKIKGEELLKFLEFDLPSGFGNTDMTLKGNAKKIEKRLDFLAVRLERLFDKAVWSNGVNMINVDEGMVGPDGSVERGVVEHNGGLGSALGNLLVYDKDTDALKFDLRGSLPELAFRLANKLKASHDENLLTAYRFKFRIDCFPKAYFSENWYEEYLVRDFIGQYWLCTGQAKEDAVENVAKKEVNKYVKSQTGNQPVFRAKTDAIFLMLHDIIQKWWMLPVKANYLTEGTTFIQRAISDVVDNPLLSVLNVICVNKLVSSGMEFNEEAVNSLGLDDITQNTILISTHSVSHTTVKLIQHYKHLRRCTFIDFNYVTNLMFCNFHDLAQEVQNSDVDTLVLLCNFTNTAETDESICEVLTYFLQDLEEKNIIEVVDTHLYNNLKTELTCSYQEIQDTKISLADVSREPQELFMDESKVVYQGQEVNLRTVIGEETKHLITSHTLQKLIKKDNIDIGKPLTTSSYNKIKQFYVERNLTVSRNPNETKSDESVPLIAEVRTLKDLYKDIVVVTAPPGMGKSTLLTHLSLETKKRYPEVWIARINLLTNSKQFHQWKKNETTIDKAEALAFLCKAACNGDAEYEFINTDEGFEVKRGDMSAEDLLQADLFVHCYMKGKAIILFDGFDEICPLYEAEVIQLIKVTANVVCDDRIIKPKLWIASRSYNNVKHVIEREFGSSYSLEPLSQMDHQIYLNKLWRKSMRLDEFTHEQLLNVNSFIDYMRQFWHLPGTRLKPIGLKPITLALYDMYSVAVQYFQNEISNIVITPEKEMFKENWNLRSAYPSVRRYGAASTRLNADFAHVKSLCQMSGSPLHIHIAAEFFGNQIKYNLTNYDTNKWDLGNNTFFIYEQFLETKLLKIRFEEKNRIDIYNPDNIGMHERERKEFIDMHRKLAFYSIFQEKSNVLMSEHQLSDVNQMIDRIKYATEKTGVIDCVVDGVPRFVHLIFAEYFAVDYVCSTLKMAFSLQRSDIQKIIWQFLLSPSFKNASSGLSNIFDCKLVFDAKLIAILEEKNTQKIVFDTLMGNTEVTDEIRNIEDATNNLETLFFDIISREMKYTTAFILKCITGYLARDDVDKFVSLISYKQFLRFALQREFDNVVRLALDYLREISLVVLERVLENYDLKYGSDLCRITNDHIISDIKSLNSKLSFNKSTLNK